MYQRLFIYSDSLIIHCLLGLKLSQKTQEFLLVIIHHVSIVRPLKITVACNKSVSSENA